MAIDYSTISGDDATNFAGDQPTLFAMQRLTAGQWSETNDTADNDDTDGDYPVTAAFDGHMGAVTKPDGDYETTYFIGTLPSSTVDALFLHIPDADGAAVTVYLSDGTTDHEITSISSDYFATHDRLFCPMLQVSGDTGNTQRQFTGVVYVAVKFYLVGDCCPSIAEIAAGQQRQLDYMPLRPYDAYSASALQERFESRSGIVTKYKNSSARKVLNAEWLCNSSTMAGKFISWWDDTDGGFYPWVWCPSPQSAPNTAWVMVSEGEFAAPYEGPIAQSVNLTGIEQGGSLLVDE